MKYILFLLSIIIIYGSHSQVVNGYAKVTDITGSTLTINNVNEAADSFEDGEWVVLMQVQGNVIGTTTDVVGFGNLGTIGATGLHEIRQIASHTESGGIPTTVTLTTNPNFTYSTCTNCSVQIITFRKFGVTDYTTTANMSALAWNGNIGGVLAFYVDGKLTLAHNLTASELGFRGATTNGGGSTDCTGSSSYRLATNDNHANKGEGIYKATNTAYAAGRARILNGGGGGNSHNAGGGGGGNFTAGGTGGPGWPTCSPSAGGLGGLSLSSQIAVGRLYMGGSGGAGEGNDGYSTSGKNGGGIILIKADTIETVSCAGISVTANGGSVPGTGGNDGGGGGGGGGSIVFEVDAWSISPSCLLTISANGGNGGNVNTTETHGGGGGGGQGVIFFSTAAPTSNVTIRTNSGTGGCNNNSVPCNSIASSGSGTNGSGILGPFTGPLPIELVEFTATQLEQDVRINWTTKSERNNAYFIIEKSLNGKDWTFLYQTTGAGNSNAVLYYQCWDFTPNLGINYYRLKQVDFDGTSTYSEIRSVDFKSERIILYPNPAKNLIQITGTNSNGTYQIFDALGRTITSVQNFEDGGNHQIDITNLPNGTYIISITQKEKVELIRFVVSK